MSEQLLKDRNGSLIGKIKILSSGKHELRDKNGGLKGFYDPKSNETRDAHGSLVAKGNLLTTLL